MHTSQGLDRGMPATVFETFVFSKENIKFLIGELLQKDKPNVVKK